MPVTGTELDEEARTLTVTTELPVTVAEAWTLWEDPRRLERWWGPPSRPASFTDHRLEPGARCAYVLADPDGPPRPRSWRVVAVDAPHTATIEDRAEDGAEDGVEDGADPSGAAGAPGSAGGAEAEAPTTVSMELVELAGAGTRMVLALTFPSDEAMAQRLADGATEELVAAVTQIDALEVGTD